MTELKAIRKNFDKNASHYEAHAIMQKVVNERLIERLDYLKIQPKIILDLGCGTGISSVMLQKKYPQAKVIGLDIAQDMLACARKKNLDTHYIQADARKLPFSDASVDLIFSNQAIHWLEPHDELFSELNRIMSADACLFFSTLGPDTFKELNYAWSKIDNFKHCHEFTDMHNIGDLLINQGFAQPVLDLEYLTLRYSNLNKLLYGLKSQGIKNQHQNKRTVLTTAAILKKLDSFYPRDADEKLPITYEIVYGHAWKQLAATQNNTAYFAIDKIKIQSNKGT